MNKQEEFWMGPYGTKWAQNLRTMNSAYEHWEADSGVKLKDLLQEFFWDVPKDSWILECGCGPGWVLKTLQDLNFTDLIGCDINITAIDMAKQIHKGIKFYNQSIEDYLKYIGNFDLILTSAFLIHIHPDNLEKIMQLIYRRTDKYIFGRELSSEKPLDCPIDNVNKREWKDQYWTRRFKDKWLELYPDLKVVKYKLIPMMSKDYIQTEVYLLEK